MAGELLAQVLSDQRRGSGQVVRAMVASHLMHGLAPGELPSHIILPQARRELVEQFRLAAQRTGPLEEVFGKLDWLEIDVQNEEVLAECFANRDTGWDRFRAKFPRSKGIVEVSCPAFTTDFSQAMIEYGFRGDWLFGFGECCLYQREDGQWRLVEKKQLWVS